MGDRLPLIGGAYAARSIIASCTRAINLFPEKNPKDSPVPLTHYQRPGLALLGHPPQAAAGRNIWAASNGAGYAVIGANVYSVDNGWNFVLLGQITPGLTTPCSMVDNGIQVMLVDGSANGWTWNLVDNSGFAQIADVSFSGADRVDYIDTFVLWNVPGTNQFRSTLSNQILPLDPLYIASKTNWPDPLASLIVNKHELVLLGQVKTERWYDAGDAQFPFAELPGDYIEHGVVAKYSVASADIAVYFLGRDLQGIGVVFRLRGYTCERISNHALEVAIRKMYSAGTIADAIGYTYQQDGHLFYVLSFPSGNQTWVFDEAVGDPEIAWHQRVWVDGQGALNRDRTNGYASLYGKQVSIDWENGDLYSFDLDKYSDTVNGVESNCTYIRTFPHLMSGLDPRSGAPVLANGKMVKHERFLLDIEVGNAPQAGDAQPVVYLRWSDDRGKTYGQDVLQPAGALGQYETRPQWRGIGQAMDRVYEVEYSHGGAAALNGAWVEGTVLGQ